MGVPVALCLLASFLCWWCWLGPSKLPALALPGFQGLNGAGCNGCNSWEESSFRFSEAASFAWAKTNEGAGEEREPERLI